MSFELSGYQYWWAIALTFVLVEFAKPHGKLIWVAFAAMISGLLVKLLPDMAWIAVVNFVIMAPALVWLSTMSKKAKAKRLIDDVAAGKQYLGKVFVLEEPVIDGKGTLVHSDNTWLLTGEDAKAGERMVVVGVNGNELTVEKENQV